MVLARSEPKNEGRVSRLIEESILPLVKRHKSSSHEKLAKCVHCPGEYHLMAEWNTLDEIKLLEADTEYTRQKDRLDKLVREPVRREVWEILA